MSQKIRIKLKSYDHNLVDKSAEKIVKTVKVTGAIVSGPIPLPTHKRIFTVNRSTFVNKKSREQFELSSYKRLIDIYSSTAKTVDALMKLELPSGQCIANSMYQHVCIRMSQETFLMLQTYTTQPKFSICHQPVNIKAKTNTYLHIFSII